MKILIAEDSAVSRKLLSSHLTKWGHDITEVPNGEAALEAYRKNPDTQIAVLDWMMPGMEGPEVCKVIKSSCESGFTYVIMLTARDESDDLVEALDAGADDYITKPFEASELKARLRAGERIVNLQASLHQKISELENALSHVRQLQACLPMCAWCHKIRDDENLWSNVEDYLGEHTGTDVTHGICPECLEKNFGTDGEDNDQPETATGRTGSL